MIAADAAGHPHPETLRDAGFLFIGQYVGSAHQAYGVSRDYIDWCLSYNVGVLLIFEEWGSQFLGGYGAAIDCCARMMAGWDALGAPRDGTVLPAVVIVDPTPDAVFGNEQAVRDFARGWNDALPFTEFTGYGSKLGLDLAGEVAPKMTRRWGVGTWGFGERGDGSLPESVPADMIQHGNLGSPVPGTDMNTLFRPDMGQWGSAHAVAKPRAFEEDDMFNALIVGIDGLVHAYAVQGTTILYEYPAEPRGAYGIPQAAIDSGFKIVRLDDKPAPDGQPGTAWDRLLKASQNSQVPPGETVEVAATPDNLTTEQLLAELRRRLQQP
jgi:hypothetical protein